MQKLNDALSWVKHYWFIVVTAAVAILIYLYDRRGKKIEQLLYEIQKEKLNKELDSLVAKAATNEMDFKKAKDRYDEIKSRYSHLFTDQ